MAANRSKSSARRSQSLPADTVPAISSSNEPEAKTDVDNLSTAIAKSIISEIQSLSAQRYDMCLPLSSGPPSPTSTACLSKDSGVLSDFYDSSEDEVKNIRVDIDTSALRTKCIHGQPRTRTVRRHRRRRRKRMEYRHERGSGGGEGTHSKFKMKATRVAVSNQLTYRTRSPHPPVMMTGQSSVACTTAQAGSWLDTAPISRSLPSITDSSFTVPDQTLPAQASPPIFRQTFLPQYGFTKSLLSKSRSFSEIDENMLHHTFETCSSEGQSHHPTSQKELVNEFSPPSLEHLHIAGNAGAILFIAKAKASPKIEETKAEVSPKIEETTLSPEPITRSPHFTEAEKRAGIPFLHHKILECDHHSREYTIQDHDITFRIPEGAVLPGKKIQFEIAVAMYGPFKFEKDTQAISPILWLCFEEGITLNKPFHVILPHYLTGLTYEKAQYHQVVFAKAPHSKYSIEDGQMKYSFQPCDSEPYFASCGGRNFGVLVTNHTCFYCLQANKTPELAMDAGYCLTRIEYHNQRHMEVTFTAVYCLRTCLKAMEEQFPCEEGYRITDYKDFKFKENTEPHVRVVPTCECDKLVVTLNPTSAKIRAGDINFWRKDLDAMQLRHEKKMYPPRVKMTVGMKNPDDRDIYKLSVKIEGCSEEDQLDIQLCFPPSTPPSVSGSASSRSECQSPKIKVQERPELKDIFRELLPLSADWNIIGTLLGLPEDLLERIRANEERAENRLQKVLSEWLKQVDPRPTWAALAEAVEPVDKVKAQEIKTRYIDIKIDLQ